MASVITLGLKIFVERDKQPFSNGFQWGLVLCWAEIKTINI